MVVDAQVVFDLVDVKGKILGTEGTVVDLHS